MPKISKMTALRCVVEAMDKDDYKTANEIMAIIYDSIENSKKNNIVSSEIELSKTEEEQYFNDCKKVIKKSQI